MEDSTVCYCLCNICTASFHVWRLFTLSVPQGHASDRGVHLTRPENENLAVVGEPHNSFLRNLVSTWKRLNSFSFIFSEFSLNLAYI